MSIVNRVSKTSVDESSSGGQLEYGGVSTLSPDEEFLAGLGYKQELKRQFSKIELFGVSFSIIGILPSIASVLVYAIPDGGTSAMVWGWAVSAFLILFIALSLAELGSAMPTSGGLYYWTFWFSSPRWRCLLSWMVGYSNTIGIIGGVASVDWGLAVQIMAAASIGSDMKLTSTTAQTFGVYAAILICHATICSLATVVLARLHNLYIALNLLLCLAVIIALPVATPREFKNDASYALGSFENFNGWPDGYAFILSFLAPVWTIGCFDSSVHISEEATNSRTAVPFAMITSVTIAGVVGWAINMAIAFNMGTDLNAILSSPIGQPLAAIFFNSFGKNGTLALWSFIIIAQFMMGSSILLASSRQTFAFARDGGLPFSRFIYRVNPYTKTPVTGVWFAAFIALALGLLAFAGPAAITAIFSISIAGQNVAYTIPIIARFTSKTMFKPGPFYLGKLSLPVAIIAVTWMIFNTTVFLFPSTPKPGPVPMNYTIVVLGGVFVLALIYFYFPVYGGIHWFNGPVRTFGKVSNNKLSENLNGEGPDDSQEVQTDAKGMDDYVRRPQKSSWKFIVKMQSLTEVETRTSKLLGLISCPLASSLFRTHPNDLGAQLPLHLDELKSAELVPLEWRSWWDWSGKSADRWKALVAASNEFQRRDGCSTADSKGTYPELPDELHFLISEVNLLSLPRFPNIVSLLESTTRPSKPELPAFDISTAGMSPKKHHEVSRMTSYVLDLLKKIHDSSGMDVKYIVDIGAGQGYLSRSLCSSSQVHVLALDSSSQQTRGSERRLQKHGEIKDSCRAESSLRGSLTSRTMWLGEESSFHNHPGKTTAGAESSTDMEHAITDWVLNCESIYRRNTNSTPTSIPVVFVALHACGSLTPTILRKTLDLRRETISGSGRSWFVAAAVIVGCCYNLIEKNDFPLSTFVRTQIENSCPKGLTVSPNHLQLAAQIPSQWLRTPESASASEVAMRKVLYRALIAPLLIRNAASRTGLSNQEPGPSTRLGKLNSKAYESFSAFLQCAGQKLGRDFTDYLGGETHGDAIDLAPIAKRIESLHALRCLLGAPMESLIILDRFLWLQETFREKYQQSSTDIHIVNLFDQGIGSGRNIGLTVVL